MPITHKFTLVCDDVRREDNGKLLILGVYNQIILVPQFPVVLPMLTFLHYLDSDRPGTWSVRMRLEHLETGQRLLDAMGIIGFQQPGGGTHPVRIAPAQFQVPGVYNFVLEVEGQANNPFTTEFTVSLPPMGQAIQGNLPMPGHLPPGGWNR